MESPSSQSPPTTPAKQQQADGHAPGSRVVQLVPPAAPPLDSGQRSAVSGQNSVTLSGDKLAALRFAVYSQITSCLPMASCDQYERWAAELMSCSGAFEIEDAGERARTVDAIYARFGPRVYVTPDLNETRGGEYWWTPDRIERNVRRGWDNYLHLVPGFYRDITKRWRLALPTGCIVYAYPHGGRAYPGLIAGLLFQPLKEKTRDGDRPHFWLLSSAKYGGPKAVPLSVRDRQYFAN